MALRKCPECGKEFSDQAVACPNCGYQPNIKSYGAKLGKGIKEGLKGLNTVASPKKRKTCISLILIPLILFVVLFSLGVALDNNSVASAGIVFGLCLGIYQFYVGKFKMGIIYTITFCGFLVGSIIDLLKLLFTKTFKDSNGFPLLY